MKNVTRIIEALANNPETTEKETQTAQRLRELLIELEKMEKPETSKEKKTDVVAEAPSRVMVLNTERMWSDTVRAPAAISVDLLTRARQLCQDSPMLGRLSFLFFFFLLFTWFSSMSFSLLSLLFCLPDLS